jgi:hypothetical protein
MTQDEYRLHDIVKLKKQHPCGTNRWEILRVGMDFRLRCLGCGRIVMMPRRKFEKAVREVLGNREEQDESSDSR